MTGSADPVDTQCSIAARWAWRPESNRLATATVTAAVDNLLRSNGDEELAMESTFGDAIELETLEQETSDTQDDVARGMFYAMAFSLPVWAAIIAAIVALTT
jgi:hypothetical protein